MIEVGLMFLLALAIGALAWQLDGARKQNLLLLNRLVARSPAEVRMLEADPLPRPPRRAIEDDVPVDRELVGARPVGT